MFKGEVLLDLGINKLCSDGLCEYDIDDLVAIPVSGLRHEGFTTGITLIFSEAKLFETIDAIASEGASRFFNVRPTISAFTYCKYSHPSTPQISVLMLALTPSTLHVY